MTNEKSLRLPADWIGVPKATAVNIGSALVPDESGVAVGLPGSSGADVARFLRTLHPNIPIVLCTGFDKRVFSAMAAELELRVVEKPIEDTALVHVLLQGGSPAQLPRNEARSDYGAPVGG